MRILCEEKDLGRINWSLDDELETKVRVAAVAKFGDRKGKIKKAVEEALRVWLLLSDEEITEILARGKGPEKEWIKAEKAKG